VLVETKFDGERIQCHMQDKSVMFFSRNSNDYTNLYGGKLGSWIKSNVSGRAVVLDGEVIVWDNELERAAPFGSNKTVAM